MEFIFLMNSWRFRIKENFCVDIFVTIDFYLSMIINTNYMDILFFL